MIIFVRVSVAAKRHHDHGNFYRGTHLIGVARIQFRGSVHYLHAGEHGSMQANMVLQ